MQCIVSNNLPHMTYDILLGTKIIQQQQQHIYNIYVENDKNIEVITNGIGFKRYLSQKLYNLHKISNQQLCYCCIDSTSCLLSGKKYTTDQLKEIDSQNVMLKCLNITNKVLWEEGIKQFFIDRDKPKLRGKLVYGFKKFTDECLTVTKDSYIESSSIYKFIFWNNNCEEVSKILYDPFCIELKEDVDWLFRVEVLKICVFWKNVSFSLCKLGANFCTNETTPEVNSSIKTLDKNTLSYYYNLMNRNLMYVLNQGKSNQYTIVKEVDSKQKEQWYCLFTLPSITLMNCMGLQKKIILKLGSSNSDIRTLQSQYPTYKAVQENISMIRANKISTIIIGNPIEVDYDFSRHCGFGSYTRATFQILKAFGIAYVNFDKEHPSKLYSYGERTLSDIIEKLKRVFGYY